MTGPTSVLELGGDVTFELWPGGCCTVYADGYRAHAERPDTPENRAEAADQGYRGDGAVRRSLVEHELLHSLVSRNLLGCESRVLRHEAGAEPCRYALRLYEEALTISAQRWMNTGCVDPVLLPYVHALPVIQAQLHAALWPNIARAA